MPIRKRLAMPFPWTLRGLVSALCIFVVCITSGMILRESVHKRLQMQGSHQARMAVPFTEGHSEINDNPYRPDVQRTIYLGKQPLGAPVRSRDGDMWILEEPPKVQKILSFVKFDELPLMTDASVVQSQCPKTIWTVARNSKWFHTRYEQRIKLFMDYEDVRNYSVYRKLEHYDMPFGFRSLRRQQLADILSHPNFTNPPLFPVGERPECLRCAVVGSGGVLNGSRAGKEIDSHDLVFRLNTATSKGRFAQDVGIKTSLYTFFPESMQDDNDIDKNALYAFAMFKEMDLDYAGKMVREEKTFTFRATDGKPAMYFNRPRISPGKLKIIHPDFFRYVHSRYLDGKKPRPTTGALVAMLAVHICDEVTIYGFGYDPRYSLHYYDEHFVDPDKSPTECHDVHNERGLWEKLHKEGVIRFFYRDTGP